MTAETIARAPRGRKVVSLGGLLLNDARASPSWWCGVLL